jgi:hypothetical protein
MPKVKIKSTSKKVTPSEERVRNAVVGHIVGEGFTRNLDVKANNQHGVDIYAEHGKSSSRRILIEVKGHSPGVNITAAIYDAWGQLMSRVTTINSNRIHGLAFPSSWEKNVAKLSSPVVGAAVNVHFFFC